MPDFTYEFGMACNDQRTIEVAGSKGKIHKVQKAVYTECGFDCSCEEFRFRKPANGCKHIKQVCDQFCDWEQFFHGGELVDGKCPKCGQHSVVTLKYAV